MGIVNGSGLYLYSASLVWRPLKACLQQVYIHPFTHTFVWLLSHMFIMSVTHRWHNGGQFGVQYLVQIQILQHVRWRTTLSPDPQPPRGPHGHTKPIMATPNPSMANSVSKSLSESHVSVITSKYPSLNSCWNCTWACNSSERDCLIRERLSSQSLV